MALAREPLFRLPAGEKGLPAEEGNFFYEVAPKGN